MEIKEEQEPKPADQESMKPELLSEKTNGDGDRVRTIGDFLDSLPPVTYKRFAPRRRRVFRFRLPFTYDYE